MHNKIKSAANRLFINSFITVLFLSSVSTVQLNAQNDSLQKTYSDTANYSKMRDSLMKVYTQQNKEYEKMMKKQESKKRGLGSSLFGVNLDVIFGAGFSNTEFDVNGDTTGLSNATSKAGPMLGVNVNFNFVGFAFSTGFNYSSKGFSSGGPDQVNANYLNIPLMFAFNFDLGKVEMDIAAGPYVGILLSQEQSQYYTLKNIDLGITGNVQGSYFFNRFIGALIGVKYEHGGLNDMIDSQELNNYTSSVKSRNWYIYSGIKFVL
jgi:Outer membrane protein beta-barrel domain